MRKLLSFIVFCSVALAAAANFWDAKPFASWTEAETKQLMSSSPWAHEIAVTDPNGGWQSGASVGGGKGGRGGVSIPSGPTAGPKIKVVVFWESALPARQAVVRMQFGAEGADSREARALLDPVEASYIVVVMGLPASMVKEEIARVNEALPGKTSLAVKGRAPVKPSKAEAVSNGNAIGLYFEFPRTLAIGPTDKEVDFATRVGDIDVKTIFRPAEMLFAGKLEL